MQGIPQLEGCPQVLNWNSKPLFVFGLLAVIYYYKSTICCYRNLSGSVLNWCLKTVMKWMRANKLLVWTRVIDKAAQGLKGQPVMEEFVSLLKEEVHSLGMWLALVLQLDVHISSMMYSAFYPLQLICQLWLFLEKHNPATMIHVLITSRSGYCSILYVELSLKMVQKLSLYKVKKQGYCKGQSARIIVKRSALTAHLFPGAIQSTGSDL